MSETLKPTGLRDYRHATPYERGILETLLAFMMSLPLPDRIKGMEGLGDVGRLLADVPADALKKRMDELRLKPGPNAKG